MSPRPGRDPDTVRALRRHVSGTSDDAVPDLTLKDAWINWRYVIWNRRRPRYSGLLGGLPDRKDRFTTALVRDARKISDRNLDRMLLGGWRRRLTAAWLIGLDRRRHYRERLGGLLLESAGPYEGGGYCFALARFGQDEDAEILVAYLNRYLPRPDCHYDQDCAMGALLYLDELLGTDHAARFVETGLWQSSAFAETGPADCRKTIAGFCKTADRMVDGNC